MLQSQLVPIPENASDLFAARLFEIGQPLHCCAAATKSSFAVVVEFRNEIDVEALTKIIPTAPQLQGSIWAEVGLRQVVDSVRLSVQRGLGLQQSGLLDVEGLGMLQVKVKYAL